MPGTSEVNTPMNEIVQDHERRIVLLEKTVEKMENGMLKIENTVLAEGREQRAMLQEVIKYSFDDQQHKRDNKTKLKQLTFTTISSLLGTGGVVFLIIQWLLGQ
ncbi:hypothetical protein [Terribacillus saccharophilus]|uniref:hypothetical protein n=1 Tax=Terribacillus saccharophilus TaxID=361277 RepID=UPI003981D08F